MSKKVLLPGLFFLLLFGLSTSLSAQSTPKYSNEFLSIGVGARALGMSNTQVAFVDDVTAAYWNPAGLLNIKKKYDISLMHAEYFAGIAAYDYAGFATQVDKDSQIALTLIRFGIDNIADTRFLINANGQIDYNSIRFFSAADYDFMVSYARRADKILKGLRFGVNAKIIYRNVGSFSSAWGFGLDAGLQWDKKGWHFGAMAKDVTGTFNAWTHNTQLVYDVYTQTGNAIPQNSIEITLPKIIVGFAKTFDIKQKVGILVGADFVTTFDGRRNVLFKNDVASIDPSIGLEVNYLKKVYVRGGMYNVQEIKRFDGTKFWDYQPNFGIGLRIDKFTIDYAITNAGSVGVVLNSNIFSLKVSF
jgi:hypothetical protein